MAARRETIPNVLTIAGSDPSGGAGIQADLKTFAALHCHGLSVITALTAQNTQGVRAVSQVAPDFVGAQIDALFADSEIKAVKIGMLASPRIAEVVADRLARYRPPAVVLDPVLAASTGDPLSEAGLAEAILSRLAPLVTLITPNLAEAAQLADMPVPASDADIEALARGLNTRGFAAVLVKGGHRQGEICADLLFDGRQVRAFARPRVATLHTHGTGCTLAAAIAAFLAQGHALAQAVEAAKAYVQGALEAADALDVGKGAGPLNHFHRWW